MADRRSGPLGTVRWRVTVLATISVVVVLVAAGVVLVVVQRRVLTDQLDETLAADSARIVTAFGGDTRLLHPGTDDEAVAQIMTLDGEVVASTPTLAGAGPIAAIPNGESATVGSIAAPDGSDASYRVVSRRFEHGGRQLAAHVAAPVDDVDEAVQALLATLALTVPAVIVLLAAVVWWLVGRTLRPVEQLRTELAAIGPRELGRRVPQPPGRDEIARLAATMNEMLQRLDASNRQQQRFVADASHELRTPLARMSSEIDVARTLAAGPARSGNAESGADVLASLGDEIDGLRRLTEDLLILARLDAGAPETAGHAVDLDDLVLEAARTLVTPGVTVDTRQVSAAQVIGHRDQLRRVVSNLLDNAARHAASIVTITLGEADGVVTFAVIDDGPGIPPAQRGEVFERFRRLDDARTAEGGGTGLGLAIVRDLVNRHGGNIDIDPNLPSGTRFLVTLPAGSSSDDGAQNHPRRRRG